MKKFLLALVLALQVSHVYAQAPAEPPQLRQVAAQSQQLLNRNTNVDCFTFTERVLAALNSPNWGHVGKTPGEGQYRVAGLGNRVGRDGNSYALSGVSHDAIYYCAFPDGRGGCRYSAGDWQVDLLGNGNDGESPLGSPAQPQWNVIPQQYYRSNNPWIPYTTAAPVPTPNPQPPTPAPVVDLGDVKASLARLESAVASVAAQQSATQTTINDLAGTVNRVGGRIEDVLISNDRIVRQLLSPPTYNNRIVGTLMPTVKPVEPRQ